MNTRPNRLIVGLLPALMLLLIQLAGCGSAKLDIEKLISDGNEVRVYEIFGMDCPGCHDGVENLIAGVPGVIASKANWEKQKLQVIIDPKFEVDDQAIYDAIKRANFTPGKRIS